MNPLQVALAVRSDFSLGESSFQVDKIVERAKALNYTHVALCDFMSVSSMPRFSTACKKAGITPIVGCTLSVVDDPFAKLKDKDNGAYRLKVFVKTERGLTSLFAALSKGLSEEQSYYHARLGLDDVLALEDCIVTSGDTHPFWNRPDAISISAQLSARFGDDYVIELVAVNTPLHDRMNEIAWRAGDAYLQRMIVTRPAFYATPEDANATDVLGGVCTNTPLDSMWLRRPYTRNLCLLPPAEMLAETKAALERVGATREIATIVKNAAVLAERCTYAFKKLAPTMPVMAPDEFKALTAACVAGWSTRFTRETWGHGPTPEELAPGGTYRTRLGFELGVIKKMGFSGYFLLVQDIVNWSKSNGIRVGPGRGSVGGSLIAYLMGITDCDPLRFGLLFERFINPDRLDLPDADLDFASGGRHRVVDYIVKKYGADKVAGIVNFSTLGAASALRDTARLSGLDPWEYSCSKLMEKEHGVALGLVASAESVPDIDKFRTDRPILWDHAIRLEGANRTLSQHAAGIVIAGEPVVNRAVVSTKGDLPMVQWDKSIVEDFGLIKIDILGLNTLDLIDLALTYIRERHKKDIDMLALPLDDPKVLDAFGRGDTTGVFQFDGGGMKTLLKGLAMGGQLTFGDIAAATALFRPGPLDAGLCDRYTQVKQGATRPYYDHPKLEPVLGETLGVLVYQEQVMQAVRVLANFTPGEADAVRKAMGKKDHAKMAEQKEKFIAGCIEFSAWTEEKADRLWETIAGFAGYGFNKSHAVEYTLISWVTMWIKVYYPAEFFAAAMTVIEDETKLGNLVADAQRMSLKVLPPDINVSTARIEIKGEDRLYAPFQAVKGISTKIAGGIMILRQALPGQMFRSELKKGSEEERIVIGMQPAEQKVLLGGTKVNAKAVASLDRVGAFHSIGMGGLAPLHPDRLRDRIELMPGFTVEMVKPNRGLNTEHLAKLKITRLIEETRECKGCSLQGRAHPVPRLGDKARFMMVFDSPNFHEERSGKILEGEAGDTVKAALKDAGLKFSDGYYTCLVKSMKPKDQKMLANEQITGCQVHLRTELDILKPPVIIAMGSNAVRWFAPGIKGSPTDLAGKQFYRADLDATIICGINMGSLFHDPSKIRYVEKIFQQLSDLLS